MAIRHPGIVNFSSLITNYASIKIQTKMSNVKQKQRLNKQSTCHTFCSLETLGVSIHLSIAKIQL